MVTCTDVLNDGSVCGIVATARCRYCQRPLCGTHRPRGGSLRCSSCRTQAAAETAEATRRLNDAREQLVILGARVHVEAPQHVVTWYEWTPKRSLVTNRQKTVPVRVAVVCPVKQSPNPRLDSGPAFGVTATGALVSASRDGRKGGRMRVSSGLDGSEPPLNPVTRELVERNEAWVAELQRMLGER